MFTLVFDPQHGDTVRVGVGNNGVAFENTDDKTLLVLSRDQFKAIQRLVELTEEE